MIAFSFITTFYSVLAYRYSTRKTLHILGQNYRVGTELNVYNV